MQVSLSSIIENDIWTPDVYFINEKYSFKHTVTMMNAMFRLLPHGDVLYSIRITMKLACDMDLSSKGILNFKYNKIKIHIPSRCKKAGICITLWFR